MSKIKLDMNSLINFINHDLMLGRTLKEPISAETDLISANVIDSLSLIQLVTHLENETGVQIDDEDVSAANFQTVNAILRLLERKKIASA